MTDKRKIKLNGQEEGPYSLQQLYRKAKRGEIDHTTEFLSEITNAWLPLSGIMEDFSPSINKLEQFRFSGVKKVGFLASGTGEDCPVCTSLCNETYSLDNVPMLPPEGCTCVPWCRLCVIAKA